jgi:hypothetical protein
MLTKVVGSLFKRGKNKTFGLTTLIGEPIQNNPYVA